MANSNVATSLIAALGYFAYDKFVLSPARLVTPVAVATSSIAVLPFVNLSSDPEQEYFSDGLSEELLNLLSRIPELKVTSRSSSFSFRGEQLDSGRHRQCCRSAIEGRVAGSCADNRGDQPDRVRAIPAGAAALTGLAVNYRNQAGKGLVPLTEGFERARNTAEKALATNPDYAEAHAVLGSISGSYDGDIRAEARHYEKALTLDPTNIGILMDAGGLAHQLGRLDKATRVLEYVVARDPVNPRAHWSLGYAYEVTERWDDAISSFRTALLLSPEMGVTNMAIGVNLLEKGEPQEALAAMQKEPFEVWRLMGLVMAYYSLDQRGKSDAALAELIGKYEADGSYNIAATLAYRNESDRAFEWLDKAVHYKDPGISEVTRHPFWFRNIRDDSRWLPFLNNIGQSQDQLDAIKFEFTIPE